jgi:hypothetical protein
MKNGKNYIKIFFFAFMFAVLLPCACLYASFIPPEYSDSNLENHAVFATHGVWIRQGAVIHSGNVGVLDAGHGLHSIFPFL